MKRLLAIDYGTKKCGIAMSDPTQTIAQPLKTIFYQNEIILIQEIKTIIDNYQPIEKIIVGISKNVDGSFSSTGKKTKIFVKKLQDITEIEIILFNENYSTKNSIEILNSMNISRKAKKVKKDALAAQKILENFMFFNSKN